MTRTLSFICAAVLGVASCAQEPAPAGAATQDLTTQEIPAEGLVIVNARIIDGNGGTIESGSVVVRDTRIVSVSEGTADVSGALVIDAQGRTVMPGFIDAHRHVIGGDAGTWIEGQAEERMREFLEAGFTTVLSAGDAADAILELRGLTAEGTIAGPRIIAAGRAPLAQAAGRGGGGRGRGGRGGGGRGDPARFDVARPPLRPTDAAPAVPSEATRARVAEIVEAGFDAVKTVIIVTPNGPETETLALIADESERLGIPTITHAVTVQDTMAAVEAGPAVLVHTPHIGMLTEEQARVVADSGIPMTSTLGIFVPFFDENNDTLFRDALPYPWETISSAGQGPVNARLLWEAGVVYGFGTDTRYLPSETLKHELKSLFLVFSEQDIVTIMTRNAAINVGMLDEIGTLEAGKLADIVLIDGDPLTDIFDLLNVEVVVKEGRILLDGR